MNICKQHELVHAWEDGYDGSISTRECLNCHRKEKWIETKPCIPEVYEWVALDPKADKC